MPHEIERNADGTARLAYAGETPWHGLGVHVEEAMTSEEAISLAGLDWTVQVGSLFAGETRHETTSARDGGHGELGVGGQDERDGTANRGDVRRRITRVEQFEDWQSIYRVEDGKPLGVCRGRYTPVQNRDVFGFMDSLVSDEVLTYETAASLKGGRVVFMLAKVEGLGFTIGDRDVHESYLLGVTSHDNSLSLRVFPTTVRVVCNNTLTEAIDSRGRATHTGIRIRHTGDVQAKLAVAKTVLDTTTATQRRMKAWLEQAADTKVTDDEFGKIIVALFGGKGYAGYDEVVDAAGYAGGTVSTDGAVRRAKAREAFGEVYNQEVAIYGESAYSLLNAITGYADHGMVRHRGESELERTEARFASVLIDTGSANLWKARAMDAMTRFTKLPAMDAIVLS